ncbi:MAG TPA: hypothetical protein DCL76_07520 [Chloroflexi bacterium]|nr:hypothetical protein [Chloroflexota bacterium]|tara:strand:+ start:259 stop:651 length:393 start_codon:yes stop_codon:yes gene_type:complete
MPTFQTFKDLSVTFKPHPITDDLLVVKDKAAIFQSIKNLLLTRKGERPFQPNLGSSLDTALFEPLDFGSAAIVRNEIRECLKDYEPRIRVDQVGVEPDDQNNGYEISLQFTIVGRDDAPEAIEFFLERTR